MNVTYDLDLPPNCPLYGAEERDSDAYRVVKSDPPTHEDLRTHQELNLAPNADPCRRASISVYSSYEQAKHRLDLTPHLGEHIAVAPLSTGHGRLSLASPSSGHIDWWPYANMRRPEDFTVVKS